MLMAVYEVRNTFGDMHSYIGVMMDYMRPARCFTSLRSCCRGISSAYPPQAKLSLAIRYEMEGAALTATLRGEINPISALGIIGTMLKMRLWPMRPLVSIHWEAFKLWRKRCRSSTARNHRA